MPEETTLGIHPGALGDLVLFGQFLAALRRRRGGRAVLAAGAEKAKLLVGLGAADEALDFDALPMEEVFSETPAACCELPGRAGRCDVLVSCFAAGDGRAEERLTALCGAREALFLPARPPAGCGRHLLEVWSERAGMARIDPAPWTVPAPWRRRAREALALLDVPAGVPYVLIHPGAGSRRKCWPLESFMELARRLGPAPGPRPPVPVFAVGPAELDWWGPEKIGPLRAAFPTVVAPPLAVLAGLAAAAAACVGNDSGPTHLAAAVGTPTVALFGPTRPEQFAPPGPHVTVIAGARLADVPAGRALSALRRAAQKV